jgi:hypothetical protein
MLPLPTWSPTTFCSGVEEHGFYWSATQSDVDHAWFYNFGRGGGMLNRHSGVKAMAGCAVFKTS